MDTWTLECNVQALGFCERQREWKLLSRVWDLGKGQNERHCLGFRVYGIVEDNVF